MPNRRWNFGLFHQVFFRSHKISRTAPTKRTRLIGNSIELMECRLAPALFTVDNNGDTDDGDYSPGNFTLREAVQQANAESGLDIITFGDGSANGGTNFLDGTPDTITLDNGQLILSDLTINGKGVNLITISGTTTNRIFEIESNATVSLNDLTMSGGKSTDGGGLYLNSNATLTITNSKIANNTATQFGGGIFNDENATLTLTNTLIDNNSASTGGGIDGNDNTTVEISDSTISFNDGGGIHNDNSNVTLRNSTIANNSGGGIVNENNGTVTMTNTTIANNNTTSIGGGIFNDSTGTVTLTNTIVAGNFSGTLTSNDISGTVSAGSQNNLIGAAGSAGGLSNSINGNIVGVLASDVFATGLLANNGGTTKTIALKVNSPAINAGLNAFAIDDEDLPIVNDQRGIGSSRIAAGIVDIGAFEVQTSAPKVVSFQVLYGSGRSFELIGASRNTLPWIITGIRVQFDQAVNANAASLSGLSTSSFTGSGSNTLTWTLTTPLAISNLSAILQASGLNAIRNANGIALDGTNVGGSGGTNYTQTLRILAGDFDDNGIVNLSDVTRVRNLIGSLANPFADVNGDGIVNNDDVNFVRFRVGNRL